MYGLIPKGEKKYNVYKTDELMLPKTNEKSNLKLFISKKIVISMSKSMKNLTYLMAESILKELVDEGKR